jgi:hypothetical protein
MLSRYILYMPRPVLYLLLFLFRKEGEAALIGYVTERWWGGEGREQHHLTKRSLALPDGMPMAIYVFRNLSA